MMKIEVKNVKMHRDMSEETECFSCTIYVDGKKAGEASNRGGGGCKEYHFADRKVEQSVHDYNDTLPEIPLPADAEDWAKSIYPMKQDLDWFVGELVQDAEADKRLRRLAKKKTLFRIEGETYAYGEWLILNHPYEDGVGEWLKDKYAGKQVEIYGVTA